jgi:poly-beta-1,6-N-acetyl-D-glucosamine synthase
MNCLLIVPFLDEERLLPVFLASLAAQTRTPDRVVLCDDGSTDGSPAIVAAFAAEHEWATVLTRPRHDPGRDRLAGAPELVAFLWALERTGGTWDIVAKMDADLELAPDHVQTVLEAFAAAPRLGIAGTYLATLTESGRPWIEPHPAHHVRGPTRFYRAACLDDISPIPVMLGWDGSDAVRARDRGWETRSVMLAGRPTVHLRPTGLHDGAVRAHARWGQCAYATGTHPLGVLASALLRARTSPRLLGTLAFAYGWLSALVRRAPRAPVDIRRAKRAEDTRRLRRGAGRLLRA